MLGSFLRASIVKTLGEQYNIDEFRIRFQGEGLLEMSQKVREIGTIAIGVINGVNAI